MCSWQWTGLNNVTRLHWGILILKQVDLKQVDLIAIVVLISSGLYIGTLLFFLLK